jgi:leader peptidase (prepilin peptidase)/N-methyltransferase
VDAILVSMVPFPATAASGWSVLAAAFAAGACVGSFLNVCIHRLPAEESVVRPRSRCPRCGTTIAWYDNVPILAWAWLRARCRACGTPIAARYPLVEIGTGALAVLALWTFGPSLRGLVAFAFTAALLLISVIDLDHLFIPDEVSLPGVLVGLGAAALPGGIGLANAAAGAALGGGVLWLVAWGYARLTGREGMGLGDVKLLAMIGAFVGWQAIPAVLVIASAAGSVAGIAVIVRAALGPKGRRVVRVLGARALIPYARRTAIPFGPFLALGAGVVLYRPDLALPYVFV